MANNSGFRNAFPLYRLPSIIPGITIPLFFSAKSQIMLQDNDAIRVFAICIIAGAGIVELTLYAMQKRKSGRRYVSFGWYFLGSAISGLFCAFVQENRSPYIGVLLLSLLLLTLELKEAAMT